MNLKKKINKIVAVSATPNTYEIKKSCKDPFVFFDFDPLLGKIWKSSKDCRIIPQFFRPTWLLDPEIILKPMEFMVDSIMNNISEIVEKNERMLITTVTKRSSEELSEYLLDNWVKAKYLHSEIDTLERLEILNELREWAIDVIVWVNLLREGLDLPEVSKIAIIDADKQGFLRSTSALIQIIWRAARNVNWKVYMYVSDIKNKDLKLEEKNKYLWNLYRLDKWKLVNEDWLVISEAMKKAINLTFYRRELQQEYNKKHNITPKTIFSSIKDIWVQSASKKRDYSDLDKKSVIKEIKKLELEMDIAAANLDFEKAAELRDKILYLKKGKS